MTPILALLCVLITMAIGDIISSLTKAFIPSVFASALIFLFGFWFIFPQDMITLANMSQPIEGC